MAPEPVIELKLDHLPFYEALAKASGETSADWRAVRAGLLTVRLVDRALVSVETVTARELAAAHLALRAMDKGDECGLAIHHVLQGLETEDLTQLVIALRNYGRVLLYRAAWGIARDVYGLGAMVAEAARVPAAANVMLQCLTDEGHAIRMQGEAEPATQCFMRLHRAATRLRARRYQLEARLGLAKLTIDRGNLPAARAQLDGLIARARRHGCVAVESKALHDRARVAGEAGDYPAALGFAYEALERCQEPREQDRILTDVAHLLKLVGEHEGARDGCLIVAATAREQELRWMATIHLMELAALDGRVTEFQQYRGALAAEALPPATEAWYYRCVGHACAIFGRWDEADDALVRMREVSEAHQLAPYIIEADDALRELQQRKQRTERGW